jgi:hypothetical protein
MTKLPPPTVIGIDTDDGRPRARFRMLGQEFRSDSPDWLAELATVAREACAALITERARDAQALALHINEENGGV